MSVNVLNIRSVKGQNGNDMREELFGKKESPFKVPDNYFDDFEKRMMEKWEDNTPEKRGKVVSIFSVVRPWIAMAAGFILIAVLYYQAPALFDRQSETQQMSVTENESEDDFINSLAFMVDENDIRPPFFYVLQGWIFFILFSSSHNGL